MAMPGRRIVVVLWGLLLLVLVLSVTPWAVGSFLGDDYRAEQRIVIARPAASVWQAVMDHERFPIYSSATLRIIDLRDESGLPGWEEELKDNTALVRTIFVLPGTRVEREVTGLGGLMVTRWILELGEIEGRSELRVQQEIHISASGMLGAHLRFVMRFMKSAEVGPRLYLAGLKVDLEKEAAE